MTTDTPAAAPITAERKLLQRCRDGFWSEHLTGLPVLEKWRKETISLLDAALSAPVAAQPAAPGVDALWVTRGMELVEAFGQSCRLRGVLQAQGKDTTKANCAIFDGADALRTHLSTALTGAATKE